MRSIVIPALVLILLSVFVSSDVYAQDDGSCPADGDARVGPFPISDTSVHAGHKSLRVYLDDGFLSLAYEVPANTSDDKRELIFKTALTAMANDLEVSIRWVGGDDGVPGSCKRFIRRLIIHSAASAQRIESESSKLWPFAGDTK